MCRFWLAILSCCNLFFWANSEAGNGLATFSRQLMTPNKTLLGKQNNRKLYLSQCFEEKRKKVSLKRPSGHEIVSVVYSFNWCPPIQQLVSTPSTGVHPFNNCCPLLRIFGEIIFIYFKLIKCQQLRLNLLKINIKFIIKNKKS